MKAFARAVPAGSLLLCALACDRGTAIRAEVRASAGPAPSPGGSGVAIDCGEVSPGFHLSCGARTLDANDPIALGPSVLDGPHARAEAPALACDPKAASLASSLAASLEAWCGPPLNPTELFESVVHLRASGATVCSFEGRAFAGVSPTWTGRLAVPAGRFRVAARSVSDAMAGCSLRAGSHVSDPLTLGRARLALVFVEGPTSLELELDCAAALTAAACDNPGVEPAMGSASVDLIVTASPSE